MSEEEKAIETLKEVASDDFDTLGDDISPKMAQNILNLINKQQKEIEYYHKLYKDIVKDLKRMKNQDPYNEYIDFCMIFFDKFLK